MGAHINRAIKKACACISLFIVLAYSSFSCLTFIYKYMGNRLLGQIKENVYFYRRNINGNPKFRLRLYYG